MKCYRIHHFAWLDYPAADGWQARYHIACQIRDEVVPEAITLVRSMGGVYAFETEAHRLAQLLDLQTNKFNGQPVLVLARDATLRRPLPRPVQLPLFPDESGAGELSRADITLQDAFGSEPVRKERVITAITDVPLLFDPRLTTHACVWYRELTLLAVAGA